MTDNKQRTTEATAHHEAGHAVAAWRMYLPFKYVTIKPDADDGSLGHVLHDVHPKWFRPDDDLSDRVRLRLERHIITSFAGQIAETKFRGRRPRFGMHSDNQIAVDMAFRLGGSRETLEAYLKYCWCRSHDVVNGCWRQIEAMAAALLQKQTLGYEDAIEVISPGSMALRNSLKRAAKVRR
jgi:hypothetical protein